MLPTSQLPWFDVGSRGQGRVVEGSQGRIRLLETLTNLLMSFHKEERILYCMYQSRTCTFLKLLQSDLFYVSFAGRVNKCKSHDFALVLHYFFFILLYIIICSTQKDMYTIS